MYHLLQIGAVSYLNSKPLIEDLAELTAGEAELVLDYPSRLADDLAEGALDVALIPSFEYFLQPDYEVVSDACVATHGPVMSVKLYSRVHPGNIRTLALDEGSRTSAALVRIMLAERYGVHPRLEPLPLGLSTDSTKADAILLIGDRAMHLPGRALRRGLGLGRRMAQAGPACPSCSPCGPQGARANWAWSNPPSAKPATGAWPGLNPSGSAKPPPWVWMSQTAVRYLRHNLHFQLGSAEQSGLKLFQQLAVQQGLAPGGVNLVFRNCPPARKSESRRTAHAR